ncbi:MAG: HAMP domain-containing protein [Caldilineaceae bacterium]|nr:HAMP domain-containing protein [Caldilineaceae bacterium]
MFQLHSLRWRIALTYLVLIIVIMAGLTFFLTRQVRTAALETLGERLHANAILLANDHPLREGLAGQRWQPGAEDLESMVKEWATLIDTRITLIGIDGVVLADSETDAIRLENHRQREEVAAALSQGQGESIRFSRTTSMDMFYLAVLIPAPEVTAAGVGVMRLALPLSKVEESVAPLRTAVLVGGLIAMLFTALLSIFIAERIVRPVRRLTHVATQMAQGNWGDRLYPTRQDEVGQLIRAFNAMAERLQIQMSFLQREQERLAIVLANMVDGVLILNSDGRVQMINPAAARLLHINAQRAHNLSFVQVVRDHRLVDLWQNAQQGEAQEELILEVDRRVIRALVTPFWDGLQHGYIMILQDLTQLRRLETMRRDFVSNISHELRTPLASLRALVETLRDGALEDPPAAQRFLDRIETEVDALAQMVQELLELSRIESGKVPLKLRPTPVSDIIMRPVERLLPQAERAGVDLVIDMQGGLPFTLADAERVQQVITNLVHNAIKFTRPGGSITVRASQNADNLDHVIISVADTGEGISAEELPRIFERFYKVDRARTAGGTGLGLAIAKHMVQAHGGEIWAESIEGKGSTFSFTLPTVK